MIDSTYGFSYKSYLYFKKKQRLWEFFLILFSIVVLVVSLGPLYFKLIKGLFEQYEALGLQSLFLANSIALTGLFGLFTGVFLTVNSLFFSRNVEVLLPLPLKSKEVIIGKIFEILIFQMLSSLVILLPFELYYGIKSQVNFQYWVYSVIVFLFSQVFPISLIIITLLPLSRILKFRKNRDFMILLAGSIILILSLIFVSYTNRMAFEGYTEQQLLKLLSDPNGLLNKFTTIYFPAFLATKSLVSTGLEGLAWIILYIAFNAAIFMATVFIGEKFYYNSYIELQETHANKSKIKLTTMEKTLKVSNVESALLVREWRYFLKVPSFAFNGLASVVIFPVLLIMFANFKNSPEFSQIVNFIESYRNLVVPFGIIMATLAASMSTLASSAFSREGKLLNELRMLPISAKKVTEIKLLQITMVSLIGIVTSIIAVNIFIELKFIETLLIFFSSLACTTFLNIVQMIIDANRPILDWDNPQRAMKQNLNVAISIPIVFGFSGGFGYLIYLSRNVISPSFWIFIFLVSGSLLSIYFWSILLKTSKKLFERDL